MIINYFGHSCFKIEEKINGENVSLITDPFDSSVGLKVPNVEADIVSVSHSHPDHANVSALRGKPFVVDCAGEYDIKGVIIEGIKSYHDEKKGTERGENIIFRFDIEGISLAHLGDLGDALDNKQLEKIGGIDILFIPVGGRYTLDAKKAVEAISQIEPRIVIPMHYKTEGSKIDIDGIDKFIKEIGIAPNFEEKLKISKRDLPSEDMKLIIFNNIK
ncbi:MBL fold metallo-hydrolase [Candidatus Falkowbacteria bacterium HGW-Falkowbacteria-1]|uniref:MBL fold metallo-hydrolase n=1 Tax=Candidatus Falkowbacteria bacterium HGW-Falkowbacteria-1 TaxID=2013768 RepID=A0A2N2EA51_9BACT|nr:MAG: MBL fold metallo-hydrolase [Candidatus Falkowbacteria bacterium HGW-Falkowbacteria-1]